MKKLIFILTISILCVSGCLSGSGSYQSKYDFGGIDKIAIVAVEGEIQNDNAKNQLSNLFVMELLNKGYAPIQLGQVEAKIRSMADSDEALEVPQDAYVQVGQILKVPAVLIINVPYFDDEILISAQLVDTKSSSVLWMDQDSGPSGIETAQAISNHGFERTQEDYLMDPLLMLQQSPPAEPQQQVLPPRPGQRPLTPRELQKIEYIVKKLCRSLPSSATQETTDTIIRQKPRTSSEW